MKKIIYTFSLIFLCAFSSNAQSYQVSLKAPQYHDGIVYLTYYYGKNMNIVDSTGFNSGGEAIFKSDKELNPGVYSIVLPGKRASFDFLVGGEQQLDILVKDSANPVGTSVVSGSKENILFRDYQQFVAEKGAALEKERQLFSGAKNQADSSLHEQNYAKLNRELNDYRNNIITGHPESMLAVLLQTMKEPPILHPRPKTHQDTLENYLSYKEHYWDGVTFMDDRIIRTPFFLPKLERYYRQVINQHPDSVIREVEYRILLSRSNDNMYKFLINWFTDEYYQPKIMGQDKVFVHLFEKYHSKGQSSWLNEKQHKAISDRAYMVMSNLIGEPAAPLVMTDITEKENSLYNIQADFTLVSFWDPTCGHCRTEMPILDSMYRNKWKQQGVKIYAVLTDNHEKTKWEQFIKEHNLNEWTHVYETDKQKKAAEDAGKPSYRQLYDIIQTPTIYLLDKEKRIVAKKLSLEQIDNLLDAKLENENRSEQ